MIYSPSLITQFSLNSLITVLLIVILIYTRALEKKPPFFNEKLLQTSIIIFENILELQHVPEFRIMQTFEKSKF